MMKINVITLFPDLFPGPLGVSVVGNALGKHWQLNIVNLRSFGIDRHQTVDDTPFGGGAGMVLRPDVVDNALRSIPESERGEIIYLSPRGTPFTQKKAASMVEKQNFSLICGRFEGIDQRVIDAWGIHEVSIGDFVLSGGEPAAFCLIDSVVRLVPGVLGNKVSLENETFTDNLLEHPHYTRPQDWNGYTVPPVLLSGNHGDVSAWRKKAAADLTRERRPDLWEKHLKN